MESIRWKQRYNNFDKAYKHFSAGMERFDTLNELEQVGIVQTYQYNFELAWKTLKDYLEEQGVVAKFPRDVIKNAYKYEIIDDGDVWLEMLNHRNLIAHIYSEKIFNTVLKDIENKYFNEITKVHNYLGDEL